MLAFVEVTPRNVNPLVARTAVGSLQRSFTLPMELSGTTVSINGVMCGIKSINRLVNRYQIEFVVPPRLATATAGVSYPLVINQNGSVYRSTITIVPTRPDIFTTLPVPGPFGRALAFNVTNRVHTTEPFAVATVKIRGGQRVPSLIRLRLTGVKDLTDVKVRIGNQTIPQAGVTVSTPAVLIEPGVYTVDFQLPFTLNGAGDQPIVVIVRDSAGNEYFSRLDDTAPRIAIL